MSSGAGRFRLGAQGGVCALQDHPGSTARTFAPPDPLSASRYRIGLVLFVLPLALAWAGSFFGHHLPGYSGHPLTYAIGRNVVLLVSLFVLGGELSDKLRALFTQEVRVVPATTADPEK